MLYQPLICGETPYEASIWNCTDFLEHWHSELELIYCIKGKMEIVDAGTRYCLHADDVLLIAAGNAHKIRVLEPDTQLMYLIFGYAMLGKKYALLQNLQCINPKWNIRDAATAQPLRAHIEACYQLLSGGEDEAGQESAIRGHLYLFASYLLNHRQELFRETEEKQTLSALFQSMCPILDYTALHFREKISIEQAAQKTGYSPAYFCKSFKKAIGMTFHQYLNYCRISQAMNYLSDRAVSVSAAADLSGYSSVKLFCRLFKAYTRLTPTEYRNLRTERQVMIQIPQKGDAPE